MPSLMDRIRTWLDVKSDVTEQVEMRTEILEQRSRLRVIDAIVEARSARNDRRRTFVAAHPHRRSDDR